MDTHTSETIGHTVLDIKENYLAILMVIDCNNINNTVIHIGYGLKQVPAMCLPLYCIIYQRFANYSIGLQRYMYCYMCIIMSHEETTPLIYRYI